MPSLEVTSPRANGRRPGPEALRAALDAHRTWVETEGREGRRADLQKADLAETDLSRVNLSGADLCEARLKRANLRGADLRKADLTGAQLQGADLTGADLRGAILTRAGLRDANFAEADLTDAVGLLAGQLGGASLAAARLSEAAAKFEGLANVAESSKTTQGLFTSIVLVCAYTWLTVASTRDVQLLNNAAPSSSRLPILGTEIPLIQFYMVAPILLLCLYVYFHLCLQRLWEELSELPAVFPDGRPLDKKAYPWLLNVLVRAHVARLREGRSHLARWQARMSVVLAWGLVPLTLVILWLRYLPAHDWRVSALHAATLAVAVGAGVGLRNLAASTLRGSERRPFTWTRPWRDARARSAIVTAAAGLVLGAFTFGGIEGVNPDVVARGITPSAGLSRWRIDPRYWAPQVLALAGVSPFAHLDDSTISTKPANWSGPNDVDYDSVKGADLEGRNLRFGMAYNAFLINGFLKRADLRGSDFREADLRRADFREADLTGANFRGADLRKADLRWARMAGTNFKEAKKQGVIGIEGDLSGANLTRADLREADFSGANLTGADLTGAKLDGTILSGANLTRAVGLTSGQLETAVLDAKTQLPAGVELPAKLARKGN